MFNIRNIFNKNNDMNKNNVKIVYEDGNVKNKILSWCKYFGINDLGELLVKLGFNVDDVIYLYESYGNLSEVIYSVNKDVIDNNNILEFNYKNKEITIGNKDGYKIYLVNCVDNKYDIELGYQNKKISDKISCFRTFKNNLFIVDNGDYELSFEVCANCLLSKDSLDKLEDYLVSLEFPVVIDEVYKKICSILNLELSMMEMFNLSGTKNVGKKKVDLVLDNIMIQNGEMLRFIKTVDNKRITVDYRGNWYYDRLEHDLVVSLRYQEDSDDKYTYCFKNNEKEKFFSMDELIGLKNDAIVDIDSVKKLVRENFSRR
mgnify:CR=1 FL=1